MVGKRTPTSEIDTVSERPRAEAAPETVAVSEGDYPPAPEPPPAQVKTAEAWAEMRGLLPQYFDAPSANLPLGAMATDQGSVPVDISKLRGPRANPEYWRFAAAKAAGVWPHGLEMTLSDFDAAIKAAGEHVAR